MEETNTTEMPPVRPQFLKVLCILTFIGAGLMLLFALLGAKNAFMSPEQMQLEMMNNMSKYSEANPALENIMMEQMDGLMEAQKYAFPNWTLGLLGNILTLFAAISMWKFKKSGFYLYCIAELVPSFISMFVFGGTKAITASMAMFGMSGMANVIIGALVFFDLLFIALYALNLKHLK